MLDSSNCSKILFLILGLVILLLFHMYCKSNKATAGSSRLDDESRKTLELDDFESLTLSEKFELLKRIGWILRTTQKRSQLGLAPNWYIDPLTWWKANSPKFSEEVYLRKKWTEKAKNMKRVDGISFSDWKDGKSRDDFNEDGSEKWHFANKLVGIPNKDPLNEKKIMQIALNLGQGYPHGTVSEEQYKLPVDFFIEEVTGGTQPLSESEIKTMLNDPSSGIRPQNSSIQPTTQPPSLTL